MNRTSRKSLDFDKGWATSQIAKESQIVPDLRPHTILRYASELEHTIALLRLMRDAMDHLRWTEPAYSGETTNGVTARATLAMKATDAYLFSTPDE